MTITFAKPATEIPRDRWGRPLIVPPDGGKPVPYQRVSKLAKYLGDTYALDQWRSRQVVIGLARRPDLVTLARSVGDDKDRLNEIARGAMDAAESDRAANLGTALHALTEQVDDGADIDAMPLETHADLAAYRDAMKGITVLAKEVFIVCDELEAAGSFDKLLALPDGRIVIGDVKTGAHEPRYPFGTTQQIAVYSRGHIYADGKRAGHLPTLGIDQSVGVMIHMPAGTGTCTLYELDIDLGWRLASTAVAVQRTFKGKPISEYRP